MWHLLAIEAFNKARRKLEVCILNLVDFKFGNLVHVYNYPCELRGLILAVLICCLVLQTAKLKTPPNFTVCTCRIEVLR